MRGDSAIDVGSPSLRGERAPARLLPHQAERGIEEDGWGRATRAVERIPARLDVEVAHEARELPGSIAALGAHRPTVLTLRAVRFTYREIQELLGVTYIWVNRHVTEGRQALRRADAAAEAEVEAAVRAA